MTSLEFSVFGFKYQNNECHILSTGQLLFCTVSPTDFQDDLKREKREKIKKIDII